MLKEGELLNAVSILKKGGIIIHPTDTIFGLACDILAESAVEKIYKIKQRNRDQPLLLLVDSIKMLKSYVKEIHPRTETLLVYHRRPLTLIYSASQLVPEYLTTNQNTIGIRLVHHELCKSIIQGLGRPITSTSANISGEPFAIVTDDLDPKITEHVDLVLPMQQIEASSNKPSIVARFDQNGELIILRS